MSATGKPYGYFWNSDNGDRTYDAESFEEWTRTFFTTGVMPDTYVVQKTAGATRGVEVVNLGYCNVNGKVWKPDTSTVPVTIATASSQYPRIDSVVIERNDADRAFYIKVVTGSLSGDTPVAPAPVRSGGVYQLVLAHIYVPAGSTTIETANITDTRTDAYLCGWITGTVDEIDISQLLAQSTEQFDAWFQEMKDQLSEDAAGNLQLQVDERVTKRELFSANPDRSGTGQILETVVSKQAPAIGSSGYSVLFRDEMPSEYTVAGGYRIVGLLGVRLQGSRIADVHISQFWAYDREVSVGLKNMSKTEIPAGNITVTIRVLGIHKDFLNQ